MSLKSSTLVYPQMGAKEHWETRYAARAGLPPGQPSDFLVQNAAFLPQCGTALDIAAGEGRNALFIARRGLEVLALDISARAIRRCMRGSLDENLPVSAAVVDLTQFPLPTKAFELVVNFDYLDRSLVPDIIRALKPGGLLFFETLTKAHLKWKADFNPSYLLESGELVQLFSGLETLVYRECETHSPRPRGLASLISRKPW